jgi:acetyltransferase-like isoleucine patch superfamily enzyme
VSDGESDGGPPDDRGGATAATPDGASDETATGPTSGDARRTDGGDAAGNDDAGRTDGDEAVGRRTARNERLTRHPTPGAGNSLSRWTEAKSPVRMTVNFLVVWAVRYSPSLKLKRWLLRRLGADIGAGVSFALTATPDVFWPELVTVEDHAIVGYDATILCHEFLHDEYRTGEVVIGERAMIGAGATVLPGVTVGADAKVAANSMVAEDVPPGATVAGVPATERTGDD